MRQLGGRLPEPPVAETREDSSLQAPHVSPVGPNPEQLPPAESTPAVEATPSVEVTPAAEVTVVEPQRPEPVAQVAAPEVPNAAGELRIVEEPPVTPPPPPPAEARYPVESHRVESRWAEMRVDSPAPRTPRPVEPQPGVQPDLYSTFRRLEPGRSGRLTLEPASGQTVAPWSFSAERESQHRSPFLTIAVPCVAAVLAIGAFLWSGELRDRMHQQDATMTTLQEQNRKLADTVAEMNVEQNAAGALDKSSNPSANTSQSAPQSAAPQTAAPEGNPSADTAAAKPSDQGHPATQAKPMQEQGEEASPQVQAERRHSSTRVERAAREERPPEIVPPYPTISKPQNAAPSAGSARATATAQPYQQPSTPGTYREPFSVTQPDHSTGRLNQGVSHPPAASRTSGVMQSPSTAPSRTIPATASQAAAPGSGVYSATPNGQYVSPLAQNIEAVEELQRRSTVPLREFHAQSGIATHVTAGLGLSVRPDPARGTYTLVVNQSGGSYQLGGQMNRPLAFSDNVTHREYELVVLRIASGEVYGYLRPMQ